MRRKANPKGKPVQWTKPPMGGPFWGACKCGRGFARLSPEPSECYCCGAPLDMAAAVVRNRLIELSCRVVRRDELTTAELATAELPWHKGKTTTTADPLSQWQELLDWIHGECNRLAAQIGPRLPEFTVAKWRFRLWYNAGRVLMQHGRGYDFGEHNTIWTTLDAAPEAPSLGLLLQACDCLPRLVEGAKREAARQHRQLSKIQKRVRRGSKPQTYKPFTPPPTRDGVHCKECGQRYRWTAGSIAWALVRWACWAVALSGWGCMAWRLWEKFAW